MVMNFYLQVFCGKSSVYRMKNKYTNKKDAFQHLFNNYSIFIPAGNFIPRWVHQSHNLSYCFPVSCFSFHSGNLTSHIRLVVTRIHPRFSSSSPAQGGSIPYIISQRHSAVTSCDETPYIFPSGDIHASLGKLCDSREQNPVAVYNPCQSVYSRISLFSIVLSS